MDRSSSAERAMDGLEAQAHFECPACKREVVAFVDVPAPDYSSDHASDWTAHGAVDVECPYCKEHFEGQATVAALGCEITLDDFPDVAVDARANLYKDDGPWEYYEPPEDPFFIFNQSLAEAMLLLGDQGGEGSLVNRLVFAHLIGAIEAFLADTLLKYVLSSPTALARLIERDRDLKDFRFSLAEISTNPDLIKDTVRARLRRQIWHNLKQVSALYNKAFEIDLQELLGKELASVEAAIAYRHDCVHRNGYDKDGNKLNIFTKDYIRNLHDTLKELAFEVLWKFDDIDAQAFFVPKEPPAEPGT